MVKEKLRVCRRKISMDKMRMESLDITEQNVEKIAALFPSCITETKDENGKSKKAINFELLHQVLSSDVVEGDEAYEFTWVGKKASIVEANKPIRKTLRPCKEESVNWDTTENLYIEGDNLEALKLMQESYLGRVKMIYIDPPYNTGRDFIYPDSFIMKQVDYREGSGYFDEEGNVNCSRENNLGAGKYHSDWCSMMYSRLLLSRNLLTDDGVFFISINDIELCNLRKICNEIFGEQNFVAQFIWQSTPGSNTGLDIKTVTEYVICYANNKEKCVSFGKLQESDEKYRCEDKHVNERGRYVLNKLDRRMTGPHYSEALNYPIEAPDGKMIYPGGMLTKEAHWNWRWSYQKVQWGIDNDFIEFKQSDGNWSIYFKQYFKVDNNNVAIQRSTPYQNLLNIEGANSARGTQEIMDLLGFKAFDYPKPLNLISYLLKIFDDENCIIMDFFSGSATTAQATMQLNSNGSGKRKFVLVQLPETFHEDSEIYKQGFKNICEIGEERIRRAAKKIHQDKPDAKFDDGFRVFKLDDTNMKDVYYSADEYDQGMLKGLESNIKDDRTDLDLLFGCLLEWGLPLSLPYTSEQIEGCTVHTYNDGDLIACFDENVPESVIKAIAKRQPLRAVFRDNSFMNSPSKINVGEIFKLLAPDTRVKVI